MDIKRLLSSVLIAAALMLLFMWIGPKFFGGGGGAATGGIYGPYASLSTAPLAMEAGATPQSVTIGNAGRDSKDKLEVTITNQTAGIERVRLNVNDYAQTPAKKDPLVLLDAGSSPVKPFSTLGVHITTGNSTRELAYGVIRASGANNLVTTRTATTQDSDSEISKANETNLLDSKYVWRIEQSAPDVVLVATFNDANKPIAEIRKRFHVDLSSYEVTISHEIKNLSDGPIHVRIDQTAANDLSRDDPRSEDRYFHAAGLESGKKAITPDKYNLPQVQLTKLAGGTQSVGQFNDYAKDPYLWIASANRFFAVVTRPISTQAKPPKFVLSSGAEIPQADHVASANVDVVIYSSKPSDCAGIIRLTGATIDVAPGATIAAPLSVYMGPKKREILDGVSPLSQGKQFDTYQYISLIPLNQGCFLYTFCATDYIIRPILWLLDLLHRYVTFGNWGVAIMVLVIVVRAALHPLTRASQINMARMGKKMRDLQPKLEAIKKKWADNKQKQSEETMKAYRENNVNPAGGLMGCLPMLIQMPIWAALYTGLSTDIDLRHAPFIPGWINDLSNPDTVLPTSTPVLGHPLFTLPIFGMEIYGLNLLPLLLAAVFFIQMKVSLASQPKPADEQQAQMQKISMYSIFLFPFFLYNAPSGLNLYIFASTMGGLLDTYLVRKHLKKEGILPATAENLPTHEKKPDESE